MYNTNHTNTCKTRTTLIHVQHEPHGAGSVLWNVKNICSICAVHRVILVTSPMIKHEWRNDRKVITTNGSYMWSFVTQIFDNCSPGHDGDSTTFFKSYIQYWRVVLISKFIVTSACKQILPSDDICWRIMIFS